MTQNLTKYLLRAPRYTLHPEDNSLVRVVGPKQELWDEYTDIRNVSLTGLSFTAALELCPRLGEIIKIQFAVPGSSQMACFGIVTRLEQENEETVLVGIHFYKLDMPQRINLARGLNDKFKNKNPDKENEIDVKKEEFYKKIKLYLFFFLWTLVIFALFHFSH